MAGDSKLPATVTVRLLQFPRPQKVHPVIDNSLAAAEEFYESSQPLQTTPIQPKALLESTNPLPLIPNDGAKPHTNSKQPLAMELKLDKNTNGSHNQKPLPDPEAGSNFHPTICSILDSITVKIRKYIRSFTDFWNHESEYDSVPSETYEIFAMLGIVLLVLDILTDLIAGIINIISGLSSNYLGRVVQGALSISTVTFPVVQHLTSDYYRRQEFLIPVEEEYEYCCKSCLYYGIIDPIIWAYNHHSRVVEYRKNPGDKKKRERFYLAKQMAQLSLKNEAQLEASIQAALALYGYIEFYDVYSNTSGIVIIGSLIFSCISIARAACSDLVKTNMKYSNQPYPMQTRLWKALRILSVFSRTSATLIVNVTFILYWNQILAPVFPKFLAIPIGTIFCLIINTITQVIWGLINDASFFINDYKINDCFKDYGRLTLTWLHFIVRSPFINVFRSASLYNLSLSSSRFTISTLINLFSLVLLFSPYLAYGSKNHYERVAYTCFSCLFIDTVCALIVHFITRPIKISDDVGSRLYQLP